MLEGSFCKGSIFHASDDTQDGRISSYAPPPSTLIAINTRPIMKDLSYPRDGVFLGPLFGLTRPVCDLILRNLPRARAHVN
jgi:hypothetical protein